MDKKNVKVLTTKLIMVMLCISAIVLSYVFLLHLPKYIVILILLLFSIMAVSVACVNENKHEAIYKALLFSITTAIVMLVAYIVLDGTGTLDKITNFDDVKEFILSTKQWGVIIFLLITVFQVVVLPIPAMVTVLIGVAIYGPVWSFVLSTIGTVIGSFIAFLMGKVFGKRLVAWMVGKEKTEKYAEILNQKGRFAFILMLLFPFFPDDMLCLVAGISSMSYKYFLTVICLTRPVMIAVYSFFGSGAIIPFSGWGIPVWIALFCAAFVVFMIANKLKNVFLKKRGNFCESAKDCEIKK